MDGATTLPPCVQDLSPWGDLVCPACRTNIMTPDGMELRPGAGTCPVCRQSFTLTLKLATLANQRARAAEQP